MPHAPFHGMDPGAGDPQSGDNARLREIYELMAELEITSPLLLDQGLKFSYGWDLPATLPDKYPVSLRYPAPEGVRFASQTSVQMPGHPGGRRIHNHTFEIFLVIAPSDSMQIERLMNLSVDWLWLFDAVYSRNARMGGRLTSAGLRGAVPGALTYAGLDYFGWKFRGELVADYLL